MVPKHMRQIRDRGGKNLRGNCWSVYWLAFELLYYFKHRFRAVPKLFQIMLKLFGNITQLTYENLICMGRDVIQLAWAHLCSLVICALFHNLRTNSLMKILVKQRHVPTHARIFWMQIRIILTQFQTNVGNGMVVYLSTPLDQICSQLGAS